MLQMTATKNEVAGMIIMVKMKNIIQRGNACHFRMGVPKDCVKTAGKSEITQPPEKELAHAEHSTQ